MSPSSTQCIVTVDTETTGLRPYHGDRPFLLLWSASPLDEGYVHDCFIRGTHVPLGPNLREATHTCFHNAKFDMAMLEVAGIKIPDEVQIWDTQVAERILHPKLWGHVFSLDKMGERYGLQKDSTVEDYIKEHKLWTVVDVPGKKVRVKNKHYDQVPRELIVPYGKRDVEVTGHIRQAQVRLVQEEEERRRKRGALSVLPLLKNEMKLVRTVYEMERHGVLIDKDYCLRAAQHEGARMRQAAEEFERFTGQPFKDSGKLFAGIFEGSERIVRTEKGNPSFEKEVLETYTHPAAKNILEIRDAKHKADYYHGFLYHADSKGFIHPSLNQHQTITGRFSSSNPNLQNLERHDKDLPPDAFSVRRAIVPPKGMVLVAIDYDQMEYRLLADLARADGLIDKVLREGLDVHEATAQQAHVSRQFAKNVNFATIYGAGREKLAGMLKVPVLEAEGILKAVRNAAPEMTEKAKEWVYQASNDGVLFNWFGRRYDFTGAQADFTYKAPNYMIQGGTADVIKIAMNQIRDYLLDKKSTMVLQVHDELIFYADPAELESGVFDQIKAIMEAVYPYRRLKLTAGIAVSETSLADKKEYA